MQMHKLKILQIGQNYRITGGSDRYLLNLQNLLEEKGHEVIPFAANHADNIDSLWWRYFPTTIDFDKPKPKDLVKFIYSSEAASLLRKLILDTSPDIAHLHIYYGKITASILPVLRSAGIPIVQTLHEYKTICSVYTAYRNGGICCDCSVGNYYRAVVRRCNRGQIARSALSTVEAYISHWLGSNDLDHYFAVSDFQRKILLSRGMDGNKVSTLHNFIDCKNISPAFGPGEYVLYFGRLEKIKGVFTLLEASKLMPKIRFLFVGEGSARADLSAAVKNLNLDNVSVIGFRGGKDLDDIIRNALCVVVPSECYETFGLTVIESFARAKPVIASAIGGVTELIEDGETGFLFEPGNVKQLVEILNNFIINPQLAKSMGEHARDQVLEKFSPESHYMQLMLQYQRLLENR